MKTFVARITIILVALIAQYSDGSVLPSHECFNKAEDYALSSSGEIQLSRVKNSQECGVQCLAVGTVLCKSFVVDRQSYLCKLYNQTKNDANALLLLTPGHDYFEMINRCDNADVQRILAKNEMDVQVGKAKPAGFWDAWEPCSKTCGGGFRRRVFNCKNCFKQAEEIETCNQRACDDIFQENIGEELILSRNRRATYDAWANWVACSASCGPGTKSRTRICPAGETCDGAATESQACNDRPCPQWNPWANWNECTKTCDGGKQQRTRSCTFYIGCDGSAMETQDCNAQPCCTTWTDWGSCSVTCGSGTQARTRKCSVGGYSGLAYASRDENTTQPCDAALKTCPTWSTWTDWSTCTKSCDSGTRMRNRTCTVYGGCSGNAQEGEACNTQQCAVWATWDRWTLCSATCGGGSRTRARQCSVLNGCPGNGAASEDCNKLACPEWTAWAAWGYCSASCGGGFQKRGRVCNQYNLCPGDATDKRECNQFKCPIWAFWQDWSSCTKPCGTGVRERTRVCDMDAATCTGAKVGTASCSCAGQSKTSEVCNRQACATWGDWGAWESCSASCGGGQQTRGRNCNNDPAYCVGDKVLDPACVCSGTSGTETQDCNKFSCASWSEWEEWGLCTATCGLGKRERKRKCMRDENFCVGDKRDLDECTCVGLDHSNEECNSQLCPEWTEWGAWADCSASCAGGVKERVRQCQTDEGYCAPDKLADPSCMCPGDGNTTDACNTHTCAHWVQWTEWSQCSKSCAKGTHTRSRTCDADLAFCFGDNMNDPSCVCVEGNGNEDGDCNTMSCPTWADWAPWSTCTKTCGTGSQDRSRTCNLDTAFCAANVGTPQCSCDGSDKDNSDCAKFKCPFWSEWTQWTDCSATCNGGNRNRQRTCNNDIGYCVGAKLNTPECQCPGNKSETETCNQQKCSAWKPWTEWSACTLECGGGERKRTRDCSIDPTFCTADKLTNANCICPGINNEAESCNKFSCPAWTAWTSWAKCTVTCGGGTHPRTRICNRDATFCTTPERLTSTACACPGNNSETENCHPEACPTWNDWSQWSPCDVTCSQGKQRRQRTCTRDDAPCDGGLVAGEEVKSCDGGQCPQWSPWNTWTECSVLCGGGSQTRARTCAIPGGCDGLSTETSICNMVVCPEWGNWGPWSSCSVTCGGGQRVKTRTCAIEKACTPGESFEVDSVKCNPLPCPAWMSWSSWGECSVTCDQGQKKRTRSCGPNPGCIGSTEEFEACQDLPCPSAMFWSDWSPCTKTCGTGQRVRSRFTCPDPTQCPNVQMDQESCSPDTCPMWTQWTNWSDCSKTCGNGSRTRNRTCPVANGCVGQPIETDPNPCAAVACPIG